MQNIQLINEQFLSNHMLHSLEFCQSKDNSLRNRTHQQNTLLVRKYQLECLNCRLLHLKMVKTQEENQ